MNSTITLSLSKGILYLSKKPIPKVRLAKMIYLAYKELVIVGYYNINDLEFIRMPLGPVPVGFEALKSDTDIIITQTDMGLSYNRENYSLRSGVKIDDNRNYIALLTQVVGRLEKYSTSFLIEISHRDHSWLNHSNGAEYAITKDDLTSYKGTGAKLSEEMDNQLIQSKLVEGMKREIVKDSTALEYPALYS